MDFSTNFGTEFFTQFSPVDPFENELCEETMKSFFVKKKKRNFGPSVIETNRSR